MTLPHESKEGSGQDEAKEAPADGLSPEDTQVAGEGETADAAQEQGGEG